MWRDANPKISVDGEATKSGSIKTRPANSAGEADLVVTGTIRLSSYKNKSIGLGAVAKKSEVEFNETLVPITDSDEITYDTTASFTDMRVEEITEGNDRIIKIEADCNAIPVSKDLHVAVLEDGETEVSLDVNYVVPCYGGKRGRPNSTGELFEAKIPVDRLTAALTTEGYPKQFKIKAYRSASVGEINGSLPEILSDMQTLSS